MDESQMTLAVDKRGSNLAGWFISEMIFDCRVMWDGSEFWTRGGYVVPAPKWFKKGLPRVLIDGGIFQS